MVYKCKNECIRFKVADFSSNSANHLNWEIVPSLIDTYVLRLLHALSINLANDTGNQKVSLSPSPVDCVFHEL